MTKDTVSAPSGELKGRKRRIFVFGSNMAGRHGMGAAKYAVQYYGAIYGQGEGLQGDSYAIPTKSFDMSILKLPIIDEHIKKFLRFAEQRPDLIFDVTPIGTGLARHKAVDIAPMFKGAPDNVNLPDAFKVILDAQRIMAEPDSSQGNIKSTGSVNL